MSAQPPEAPAAPTPEPARTKPKALSGDLHKLPAALAPLSALPHWVLWRWKFTGVDETTGSEKWTKVPYRTDGGLAKTTDPKTWGSYDAVVNTFKPGKYDGIGFCLLNSGLNAFDVDNCRDPDTGKLKEYAQDLLERCKSYAEVTPSGTGIRIIGLSGGGDEIHKNYPVGDGVSVEIYRKAKRYITVSANPLPGYADELINIDAVVDEVYAEREAERTKPGSAAEKSKTKQTNGADDPGAKHSNSKLPKQLVEMLKTADLGQGKPHGKYDSRNALVFAFLTGCARSGVDRQRACDACVDKKYEGMAIFQHCWANGGSKYVLRQIERAWAAVEKAEIDREAQIGVINTGHALVLAGNKASVMKFESGTKFRLLQISAFKQWFANQLVTVGKKMMPLGDYWLGHPQRQQYEGIEFEPGGGRHGYYNLWQGFAVQPRVGDCSKFLAHIRDNAARGDDATFKWIIGWWAQIVQQPAVKMETALVLRGGFGTGKTIIGRTIGTLLGDHYLLVASSRYVTGQFNSHMASLLLLHADEAFWAGDKKSEGRLRDLVTGLDHPLEYKGVDPISVKNFIRLFVTGNPDWMIPAGFKERRWAVFDMGEAHIQDNAYFAAIDQEMSSGGREALLNHLLTFDLSTVNLRSIPKTAALLDQQIETMTAEQAWWFDTLMRGTLPEELQHGATNERWTCTKHAIHMCYVRHAQLIGINRKSTETKLAMFLSDQLGAKLKTVRLSLYKQQTRCWVLPPLAECRALFAEKIGQTINWDGNEEWQHSDPWEREHR